MSTSAVQVRNHVCFEFQVFSVLFYTLRVKQIHIYLGYSYGFL